MVVKVCIVVVVVMVVIVKAVSRIVWIEGAVLSLVARVKMVS